MKKFHPFIGDVDLSDRPERFNNPFSYVAHPLCVRAADEVRRVVNEDERWRSDAEKGKMFGVLVVCDKAGECGFLAAFSGLLDGCNDHPFFVPAVFDFISPDSYFKREEGEISNINHLIENIKANGEYVDATELLACKTCERDASLEAMRRDMRLAKEARDKRRAAGGLSLEEEEALLNESRFAKAEYRRKVKWWENEISLCKDAVTPFEQQIDKLREERKHRSAALQQWLFDNFVFLNIMGEQCSLSQIFSATSQRVPPAGAGECAAPKLLQYAFLHELKPLAMAEFWIGASPVGEVRRDGCFYGSCTSKCRPILGFMLRGMDVEPASFEEQSRECNVEVVFEDEHLMIVNKPAGILSVPGKEGGESLEEMLQRKYVDIGFLRVAHRLDMATSGLLVVAKSSGVYTAMQRLFAERSVQKRYIALLDGVPRVSDGKISLPLSADYANRPRQMVDKVTGKEAVTMYKVLSVENYNGRSCARVQFVPVTGRTHQLRMHAAHAEGLDTPIVGDELYGTKDRRLMLHAEYLSFVHPVTGMQVCAEVSDNNFE